jgi:pyruvate-formate lyase
MRRVLMTYAIDKYHDERRERKIIKYEIRTVSLLPISSYVLVSLVTWTTVDGGFCSWKKGGVPVRVS